MKYEGDTLAARHTGQHSICAGNDRGPKGQRPTPICPSAVGRLIATAENYPDLKANADFMQLQGRITELESEIADRREFYNDSVNTFNTRIQEMPDAILARLDELASAANVPGGSGGQAAGGVSFADVSH